jgi:hypothetical protein
MGVALAILGIAGTVYSGIAQAQAQSQAAAMAMNQQTMNALQFEAQSAQFEREAKIADENKKTSEWQASESLRRGAREEARFRLQARQFAESQRAQFGASGVTMSGSPLSVLADTAQGTEQDAASMRLNTLRERWGFMVEGVNWANQAEASRLSALNASASAAGARSQGYAAKAAASTNKRATLISTGLGVLSQAGQFFVSSSGNSLTVSPKADTYYGYLGADARMQYDNKPFFRPEISFG